MLWNGRKIKLTYAQRYLLERGIVGFTRNSSISFEAMGRGVHMSACAGLIRRGWLDENRRKGIIRITDLGKQALQSDTGEHAKAA